jgi:hypothetical protein
MPTILSNEVYFGIGDAIAGLGLFLIIPQYLKPIYVFRLRVLGIGMRWLYAFPGVGFVCVVLGSLSLYFPTWVPTLGRHPLFWELLGGALYAVSYSALAWVTIFPARTGQRSIASYVRAGTNLLASASEQDRVELTEDLVSNMRRLIVIADVKGAMDPSHPTSKEQAASFSESFLRILSDPAFCNTMVSRVPWEAARILQTFSQTRPKELVGRAFVHQITRQALLTPAMSGAKDVDEHAFPDVPPLAKAAFGDGFINTRYHPWEGPDAPDFDDLPADKVERVLNAAKLTVDEHIASGFAPTSENMVRMQEMVETITRRVCALKTAGADMTMQAATLSHGMKHIVMATRKYLSGLAPEDRHELYADADMVRDFSTLDTIAELVISVMENTSHGFSGFDDKFWNMARELWDAVLPRFGAEAPGMDPLQQRVTMKLIEKIKEALEGYYSPLLRQALAIIGPYHAKGEAKGRTAFKICRDLLYRELRTFPLLHETDPEREHALLPDNVRYEAETTELIHRYSFGGEDRTNLSELHVPDLSLAAESISIGPAPADALSQ